MPLKFGKPILRPSQIASVEAVDAALSAIISGGDEEERDTTARGWDVCYPYEGVRNMKMWYEDLTDIDKVISENVEVPITPLPTSNLLEKLDDMREKLMTWYAAPVTVYHKRTMHHMMQEVTEIASMLRSGQINVVGAQRRFDMAYADADEVVNFSKFMD